MNPISADIPTTHFLSFSKKIKDQVKPEWIVSNV